MKTRLLVVIALTAFAVSARAADVPVSYTVQEKPLKQAPRGTPLSFELYSDPACTDVVYADLVPIEDVKLLVRLSQLTPAGDVPLPRTVEMRTTLSGAPPAIPLYLKVNEAHSHVVAVGGACQAQSSVASLDTSTFNVKDFGATGDGVTNDAPAVQAALNAVPASGGVVYFPSGTYQLDANVGTATDHVTLRGAGKGSEILSGLPNAFALYGAGVVVESLKFRGAPGGANLATLHIRSPYGSTVRNCWFEESEEQLSEAILLVEGGHDHAITDNVFASHGGGNALQANPLGGTENAGLVVTGNKLDSSNIQVIGWDTVDISHNVLTNVELSGYTMIAYSPLFGGVSRGINIVANVIDARHGTGNNGVIRGLNNAGGTVSGLRISDNVIKATYSQIILDDSNDAESITTADFVISDNQLIGQYPNAAQIDVRGHTKTVRRGVVQNNVVLDEFGAPGSIVTDAATQATTVVLRNNRGFNPQGTAAIAVDASPFTYTNLDYTPEAVYVSGGTVSAIVKNGSTIFTASPATVWLEPNESITVTYAVAPTMVKDRK